MWLLYVSSSTIRGIVTINFIQHSRLWFLLSGALAVVAIVLLIYPGIKFGIDFTGGTLIELTFQAGVERNAVEQTLVQFGEEQQVAIGQPSIVKTADGGFIIRIKEITNEEHLALQSFLQEHIGSFTEHRFTTIGPTVGRTLKIRSFWALLAASIVIVLYVAYAFRHIPRKLNPWKFGLIAIIALLHDVCITLGVFVLLGMFTSFEMDTLFISALLIIVGYSVNDTIVIFDRVRENVFEQERGEDFAVVAERSLQESLTRSLNTGLSTLITLIVLFFFGGESIRWFVLALIIGIILGTYSSIFIATPLLVYWRKK